MEEDFDEQVSVAMITKKLQRSIVNTIAAKIGENLKGLLSEEDNALLTSAIEAGSVSEGIFDKVVRVLTPIGTALTDIDFQSMLEKPEYSENYFIRAINNNLYKQEKLFYVLFDDIDQISSISNQNYYDVIWGTILAIQKVATKLPNIRPIITLRTEVWRNVTNSSNGNRDQIDHIRPIMLKRLPSITSIKMQKTVLHTDNQEDAFKIWHLLYNIEFLTPRIADNTKETQYRYIRPSEDTTLIMVSRWNDIQRYLVSAD